MGCSCQGARLTRGGWAPSEVSWRSAWHDVWLPRGWPSRDLGPTRPKPQGIPSNSVKAGRLVMNAQGGYLRLGLWERGLEEGQKLYSFQKIGKATASLKQVPTALPYPSSPHRAGGSIQIQARKGLGQDRLLNLGPWACAADPGTFTARLSSSAHVSFFWGS